MQANDVLREGWLADCGAYSEPRMRERAESLVGMGRVTEMGCGVDMTQPIFACAPPLLGALIFRGNEPMVRQRPRS